MYTIAFGVTYCPGGIVLNYSSKYVVIHHSIRRRRKQKMTFKTHLGDHLSSFPISHSGAKSLLITCLKKLLLDQAIKQRFLIRYTNDNFWILGLEMALHECFTLFRILVLKECCRVIIAE